MAISSGILTPFSDIPISYSRNFRMDIHLPAITEKCPRQAGAGVQRFWTIWWAMPRRWSSSWITCWSLGRERVGGQRLWVGTIEVRRFSRGEGGKNPWFGFAMMYSQIFQCREDFPGVPSKFGDVKTVKTCQDMSRHVKSIQELRKHIYVAIAWWLCTTSACCAAKPCWHVLDISPPFAKHIDNLAPVRAYTAPWMMKQRADVDGIGKNEQLKTDVFWFGEKSSTFFPAPLCLCPKVIGFPFDHITFSITSTQNGL